MKANVVVDFALQFGVKLVLNDELMVERDGRFFLLNVNVKPFVKDGFFYAGVFLGKVRAGKFFPSFNLLSMLVKYDVANRIVVDRKAGWLFICGRAIFRKSLVQAYGKIPCKSYVLVLNEFGECLGFGKVLAGFKQHGGRERVAVANVLDVGDFLRRERGSGGV